MARPSARLVRALRTTADRLEQPEVVYQWSHYGHCTCGHVAQTITRLEPSTIYRAAFYRPGDWGEQAAQLGRTEHPDYGERPAIDEGAYEFESLDRCASTGSPLTAILATMYAAGLERDDVRHLERLSDGEVLRKLGKNTTGLEHARREHVIAYLRGFAELLEEKLGPSERAELADDEACVELPLAAE
jgi:hypothetical protein